MDAEREPRPIRPDGKRVLLVDDNAEMVDSLGMLLDHYGHVTRTALSGPQALEVAREFGPEVVFLDIGMPGMNGYEVAKCLRQEAASERLLLVAMTGWGREEDKRRATDAGFDHHMTKPVDAASMRQVIERFWLPPASGPIAVD